MISTVCEYESGDFKDQNAIHNILDDRRHIVLEFARENIYLAHGKYFTLERAIEKFKESRWFDGVNTWYLQDELEIILGISCIPYKHMNDCIVNDIFNDHMIL